MNKEDIFWYGFWALIILFFVAVGFGMARHEKVKDSCYDKGGIPIESRNMQITCISKEYIVK